MPPNLWKAVELPGRQIYCPSTFSNNTWLAPAPGSKAGYICAIFFDLKEAFDSACTPQKSSWQVEALTFAPCPNSMDICSYLMGRTQRVVIDGESSEPIRSPSGVPQGSILGPLLFLILLATYLWALSSLSLSMQMVCCCISLLELMGE